MNFETACIVIKSKKKKKKKHHLFLHFWHGFTGLPCQQRFLCGMVFSIQCAECFKPLLFADDHLACLSSLSRK